MPNIEGYKLTNKGNALQIKVEAGKCKLNITKLKLGSGTASGDIVNLTDLVQVEQTVPISNIEVIDDYTCRITGLVTNQGLNKTYYIREIGLYAQDPDDGEILYLVAVDKNPDVMPADNYQMIISQEFNIDVVVSNVDSVNVTSQPVHLVTDDELNKKIEEHNTSANPHENIFKRVLITEAKTAANTADWNTLTESRTYKITGAIFAADKHQPVGAVGTGELVVLKNGDDTIAQVYYANSAAYDKAGAYHRMCIGGEWTNWVYNITNAGGSLTGDLNINGKLIAKEVYATDKLLIGDYDPTQPEQPDLSNFLTAEDLQRIQDRIIAPKQTFYINANTGSDETGDGTQSRPYQTIAKALENRKKDVPTLELDLYVETGNEQYYIDPVDFSRINQQEFRIIAYPWTVINDTTKKPSLLVNYGSVFAEDFTGTRKNHWGNILCGSVNNIYLAGIELKLNNPHTGSNYATFVCETNYLDMLQCQIDIGSYTLMKMNEEIEQKIRLRSVSFVDGSTGFIAIGSDSSPVSATDPSLSEQIETNISLLANSITVTGKVQISASIYSSVYIPQTVLSNGNSGYSSSIDITYKNWN